MHVHTVFKVNAESANEAVEKVNDWLLDHCGDGWWFDYCDPDETQISTQVTTETEFQTLRQA
jgi:predicted HAD superfamily hydrolase